VSTADTDRLRRVHDQLVTAVTNLTDSAAWQQMLTVAARLPTYSPHNVVLIASQRPDATRIAGYAAWRRLGRQVRGGEHGIAILAPVNIRAKIDRTVTAETGRADSDQSDELPDPSSNPVRRFRVVHVFDISQTDGPELPAVSPRLLDGAAPAGLWDGLAAEVTAAGFTLTRGNCAPANGLTDHLARTVTVMEGLPEAQAAKTLAHELAHVRLHGESRPADMDRSRAEVEAESVAYIVTTAHGMDARDYTVPYVAGWAGGRLGLLVASAERVLSTAGEIIVATSPPANDRLMSSAASVARRATRRERGLAPTVEQSRRRPSPGLELAQ
jgi:hypothetical protein